MLFGALGQFDFLAGNFFVGNHAQQVGNAIQPSLALVVGSDEVPRGVF